MTGPKCDIVKIPVLKFFYLDKMNKSKIAKVTGLSRNTVKKYLREFPVESELIQSILNPKACTVEEVKSEYRYHFRSLLLNLHYAKTNGDVNIEHLDLPRIVKNHADELGINNVQDFLQLEIAYENLISYRSFSKRLIELNGNNLDVTWLDNADKLSKITARYAEVTQKYLKTYTQLVRELEIKYGKRFPDIKKIHNLNIQKNEIIM